MCFVYLAQVGGQATLRRIVIVFIYYSDTDPSPSLKNEILFTSIGFGEGGDQIVNGWAYQGQGPSK